LAPQNDLVRSLTVGQKAKTSQPQPLGVISINVICDDPTDLSFVAWLGYGA